MESLKFYRGDLPDLDAVLDEMLLEMDDHTAPKMSLVTSAITVLREPYLRTPFFIGCLCLQSWAFIPLFIIPSTFSLIYLYFNMPETVGREVHEIVEELMSRTNKQKISTTKDKAPIYFGDIDIRRRKEDLI
ncbi:hypothetical protein TELCIR_11038 [Teladorsagia circumcincta]|uniref:Uncharacterized protein n=1 Tax=Teladorsagia circumcincta TaxID=45464 RepID=A0A2G9UBU9_TELCI|nr:hypothetical protein TELCIR_11038 [Teladorsagia circumcincta]